ncbi:Protein Iojap, chloroplastic [Linum perenne]
MIASLPIAGDLLPIESNLSRRIDKRSSRTLGIRKLCFSQSKSRNFYPTFALRKDDNLLTNSEDSEEALDDLLNKYGKVVFRRNDEKGLVAEVDDDAETLSCDVVVHIFLPPERDFYNLEEFYGNAAQIELPFDNQPSQFPN